MKIVILGNICLDHNEGKVSYTAAGGPATFMSDFFNKTKDVNSTVISSYGKDFLPYKKELNLYPLIPNVAKTIVYENIEKNGKRSQKCHFYKDNPPPRINPDIKRALKAADILFITPLIPNFSFDYLRKVTEEANKNCIKILLPQGYFRKFSGNGDVLFREFKEAENILPLVDILILSLEDYPNMEMLSLQWVKKYGITILITKAGKGASIINKNGVIQVPTVSIPENEIVDSVGAGDIFSASFGYFYFGNRDYDKSVKMANKTAREKLLSKTKDMQISLA